LIVPDSSQGVLYVLRDAVVQPTGAGQWFAVSREGSAVGEILMLDVGADGRSRRLRVRVMESRPVMVNGALRHGIRLEALTELAGE
jgi:hypothetical protein